jgi:hypothetical protein
MDSLEQQIAEVEQQILEDLGITSDLDVEQALASVIDDMAAGTEGDDTTEPADPDEVEPDWNDLDPFSTGPDPGTQPDEVADVEEEDDDEEEDADPTGGYHEDQAEDEDADPEDEDSDEDDSEAEKAAAEADSTDDYKEPATGNDDSEDEEVAEDTEDDDEEEEEEVKAAKKWAEEHPWEASLLVAKGLWDAVCQAAAATGQTITDILAALGGAVGLAGTKTPDTLPNNARTTTNPDEVFKHLQTECGIDPKIASERLHQIKSATGKGPADNVLFDWSGGVWDPVTRRWLGSLTAGGAKRLR